MTGGIVQLSLWGAEDLVLSSQPQITFWKAVFRRPTPFAMASEEQSFQGTADFGRRCSLPIARAADLVTDIWLQVTLPDLDGYAESVVEPNATTPTIRWARYASPTIARIRVVPKASHVSSTTQRYTATLTPVGGGSTVTASSTSDDITTVVVTGLDPGKTYSATVQGLVATGSESTPASASETVIAVSWANNIGHAMLESVELEVGGSRIDRHTSDWLDIWSELTTPDEKKAGLWNMLGKSDEYDVRTPLFTGEKTLYIPLQFFFNTQPSLALPLVALSYHECRINFEFRPYKDCIRTTTRAVTSLVDASGNVLAFKDIKAYANMVYLETEERRRYSTIPHEMLIHQTQFLGDASINVQPGDSLTRKIPLEFSHPVKELVFVYQPFSAYSGDSTTLDPFSYGSGDFFDTARILINGHDRFSSRPPGYFRYVQPYQHHTRVPTKPIYVYSFALHPENAQSSGTCNYSRIDTSHIHAQLSTTIGQGRVRVFALSYNVFRVAEGLGGLSFAG